MKKRHIVIDEPRRDCGGDIYQEIFDTPEAANNAAEYQWGHLTRSEQRRRHIYAGVVTEADLDPDIVEDEGIDAAWCSVIDCNDFPGSFDSEKLQEFD